ESAPRALRGRSTASRKFATRLSPASSFRSTSVHRLPISVTTFTRPPRCRWSQRSEEIRACLCRGCDGTVTGSGTAREPLLFFEPRGVAQPGSALRSGRRGPQFKSGHPDKNGGNPVSPVSPLVGVTRCPQCGSAEPSSATPRKALVPAADLETVHDHRARILDI